MDLASFQALLTPAGQDVLAQVLALAPVEADYLRLISLLERRFPPNLARAALETAILRGEAAVKFPQASQMYFTRQAYEQATPWEVAVYRAERYRSFERVLDLGCSIGGDTLALAQATRTVGIDIDPLRLAMARASLNALGPAPRADFLLADLRFNLPFDCAQPSPGGRYQALFFDPARRQERQRVFSVEKYIPPLSVIRNWLKDFPALGVKLSPGVNLDELAGCDAGVEFISLSGELKEAALWFGPLKTARRQATLLPGPHLLAADEPPDDERIVPLGEPLAYLLEPDPAVLRAGLVQHLAERLGAIQLDPQIAYLTANTPVATPFARAWAVEDWFPFGLKRLRAYLRQRGVGRVTVKKRGSPLQPEELIHDLRLRGNEQRVVVLTHLKGEPIVLICRG
jgi:SAM-dependent methyltransferase